MPNNLARKILGVVIGETDIRQYTPSVSKGDLIKYDDALTIPAQFLKSYSGNIPASAWQTLNTNPFILIPSTLTQNLVLPFAMAIKVDLLAGTGSSIFVTNPFYYPEPYFSFDVLVSGISYAKSQVQNSAPSYPLSGAVQNTILKQIADDPTISVNGPSPYTIFYMELPASIII